MKGKVGKGESTVTAEGGSNWRKLHLFSCTWCGHTETEGRKESEKRSGVRTIEDRLYSKLLSKILVLKIIPLGVRA